MSPRTRKLVEGANQQLVVLRDLNATTPEMWAKYRACHLEWQTKRDAALASLALDAGLQ